MKKLRFASIGGWHIHTDRFLVKVDEFPECEVAAVWDSDRTRGRARAERFHCPFIEDYEKVLDDVSIDGVLITSPTREHFEQIKKALNARKHVFVEKPAFCNKEEAYQIKKMLEKSELKFLVSDPIRTSMRQLLCAKEIIESGRIGKVTTARTRCAISAAIDSEHLDAFNPELANGGVMSDLGCHAVHMLYVLLGKPEKAHAAFGGISAAAKEYGVEDNAVAVYEFENGVLGIAETSLLADRREDFFLISGTRGSICCLDRELRLRTSDNPWVTISQDAWPSEADYPLYHWIDSIWNESEIKIGGIEEAITFTEMIESAYAASAQKIDI